jgi:hypothetical protein
LSFLLDPPALLLIGFLIGKAYYLAMVFADRLFKRSSLRSGLIGVGIAVVGIFWIYSSLLYLNVISFPWPFPRWYGGTDWMLNSGLPLGLGRSGATDVTGLVIFATYPLWFYLGTELGLAGHRLGRGQRLKERHEIIKQLVGTIFPVGGAIPPSASEVDTTSLVESLLARIPPLYSDALSSVFFVFDSRFFVLAFTGRWTRFVNLDGKKADSTFEKRKYLDVWQSNPYLVSVCQILRITASYGYYSRPKVYSLLDYPGPLIPNPPSWYNPGPPPRPSPAGPQSGASAQ